MTHTISSLMAMSRLVRGALVCMIAIVACGVVKAQENPFAPEDGVMAEAEEAPPEGEVETESEPEAEAEAPLDAAPAPASAPAGDAPAIPPKRPSLADFSRRDAAVAAVLDLPRETPAAKLRAVLMLIDLGHSDVAALILPELLQMRLDAKQQAALVNELGSAPFMKLIRLDAPPVAGGGPGPLAGARAFAQACLAAAEAEARSPARIAQLIAQLNAPTEEDRYAARVDLRATGDPGIAAAFAALAKAQTEDARANLLLALADMRPAVDGPLLAVLADSQGQLRRDAAELAGHLKLAAAAPFLATIAISNDPSAAATARTALAKLGAPPPTRDEAEILLRRKIASLMEQPAGDEARGVWWSWNNQLQSLTSAEYPAAALRALTAARLARALAEAGGLGEPTDARLVSLYGLEEAALLGGQPAPALVKIIASLTPAELSTVLGDAIKGNHLAAAVALAGELGRRGDASILATSDGRPSPLAAALTSPVRELRFAALGAVMQLAPTRSFPGSSGVADSLWYFAAGAGDLAAITAASDIIQASNWAGQLRGLGYEATPVRTGRDALEAATDPATSPRLAVIVLDSDIGQPLLGEVVYQLRTSDRTAQVPILICSSAPRLATAHLIAQNNPLVLAMPRPHAEDALAALVEQALALAGRPPAAKEVRTAQAAQALAWLAKLLAEGSPYDELRRDASLVNRTMHVNELSGPSLALLATLGTAESQAALADFVSAQSLPIESRRQALAALATNVQRAGLQLSRDQILRQYDRYNASETADPETQQVLGQALDVIEKKQ
jgi:hypothetical protein